MSTPKLSGAGQVSFSGGVSGGAGYGPPGNDELLDDELLDGIPDELLDGIPGELDDGSELLDDGLAELEDKIEALDEVLGKPLDELGGMNLNLRSVANALNNPCLTHGSARPPRRQIIFRASACSPAT